MSIAAKPAIDRKKKQQQQAEEQEWNANQTCITISLYKRTFERFRDKKKESDTWLKNNMYRCTSNDRRLNDAPKIHRSFTMYQKNTSATYNAVSRLDNSSTG